MNLCRMLLNGVSPRGPKARLSVLIYHRVLPKPDPLFPEQVDAATFDRQMSMLAKCFHVMPLHNAVCALRNGILPERAACVTFDDGYSDNMTVALPILRRHGITATVFVATGFLNGGRMWNDSIIEVVRRAPEDKLDLGDVGLGCFDIETLAQRRQTINELLTRLKYWPLHERQACIDRICTNVQASLPSDLMLKSDQVQSLHKAGIEIGAHTIHHPILSQLDPIQAREEIAGGREYLQNLLQAPVRLFAYPNGNPGRDYLPLHGRMVNELGFEAAVSTAWGAARAGDDLYQLPRFTPWDRSIARFTLRMAHNALRRPQHALE